MGAVVICHFVHAALLATHAEMRSKSTGCKLTIPLFCSRSNQIVPPLDLTVRCTQRVFRNLGLPLYSSFCSLPQTRFNEGPDKVGRTSGLQSSKRPFFISYRSCAQRYDVESANSQEYTQEPAHGFSSRREEFRTPGTMASDSDPTAILNKKLAI